MKKTFLRALATLACFTLTLNPASAKEFKVDTAHSSIGFTVTHLQLSEVEGRFNDFSGQFDWDASAPEKSRLEFSVKTESINTDNVKRDGHLKGEDFFDTAKYPTMTFKSSRVEKLSGDRYTITGDLTAHGKTKTISVPASIKGPIDAFNNGEESIGFRATFKINRIDYGIGAGWQSGSDKVVGHDVFITVKGEAHQ
jgi:polyisoprenoid-binding protein YceI